MRDLTYPPIIVTAKTVFRAAGPALPDDRDRARARAPAACCSPSTTSATSTSSTAGWPPTRRVAWCGSWPSASSSTTAGRAADALAAPHRGRPRRGRGVARRRPRGVPARRRGGRDLPRGDHLRSMEIKELKTGAVRLAAEAGVPLVPVDPVGHPADDDQGPPARLLARQDHLDHASGSRCTRPARTRWPRPPSCTAVMTALLDQAVAAYPADGAAARAPGGSRPARRRCADAGGGRAAGRAPRSATRGARRQAPRQRSSDPLC